MTDPYFITPYRAVEAFETFVLPGIKKAMNDGAVGRRHMHIVCLRPNTPYSEKAGLPILFDHSIGDPEDWQQWEGKSYKDFAQAKARISWRTGMSSREVVMCQPHLLVKSDTILWGSSILNGVIVAVSGVQPYFDEMFATMTAAAVIGEASHYAHEFQTKENRPDFLE